MTRRESPRGSVSGSIPGESRSNLFCLTKHGEVSMAIGVLFQHRSCKSVCPHRATAMTERKEVPLDTVVWNDCGRPLDKLAPRSALFQHAPQTVGLEYV